jgi:hypothetical protein
MFEHLISLNQKDNSPRFVSFRGLEQCSQVWIGSGYRVKRPLADCITELLDTFKIGYQTISLYLGKRLNCLIDRRRLRLLRVVPVDPIC